MKHQARKRFGQNFLQDPNMIQQIIDFIAVKADDMIIEIGPGLGALTHYIANTAKQFIAIEIDRDLITHLEKAFGHLPNFSLVNQDVLKFDFSNVSGPYRIVGNLPYNISTPLLFHLFNCAEQMVDLNIMLQKEVVDRLKAQPGSKDYGRLSVMAQYHCEVGRDFLVPAIAFSPKPKVDSAFVRLIPHKSKPFIANDYELFANIVRDAFSLRRKQLKNSLSKYITSDQLSLLNIDESKRPEDISLMEYVTIANQIFRDTKG